MKLFGSDPLKRLLSLAFGASGAPQVRYDFVASGEQRLFCNEEECPCNFGKIRVQALTHILTKYLNERYSNE